MDKLRSTIKLFVRDWSEDVGILFLLHDHVRHHCRANLNEMYAMNR